MEKQEVPAMLWSRIKHAKTVLAIVDVQQRRASNFVDEEYEADTDVCAFRQPIIDDVCRRSARSPSVGECTSKCLPSGTATRNLTQEATIYVTATSLAVEHTKKVFQQPTLLLCNIERHDCISDRFRLADEPSRRFRQGTQTRHVMRASVSTVANETHFRLTPTHLTHIHLVETSFLPFLCFPDIPEFHLA